MQDAAITVITAIVTVLAAATFAVMIWAATQVDGRAHRLLPLRVRRDRHS
jgi:hypothetical protein